ncbi:hypothetical protein [Clostridium ganghwense]|uniref:Uncharacterized protein n=1 Tax=Clostridium ganghwense TaxID=312089 RepID=A0ABT4CVL3_9CLOT|nr:hypothetical protein [Clostridium ganghwense]MCY6372478.1 hypothetical protein [Clostridium ganghwense]
MNNLEIENIYKYYNKELSNFRLMSKQDKIVQMSLVTLLGIYLIFGLISVLTKESFLFWIALLSYIIAIIIVVKWRRKSKSKNNYKISLFAYLHVKKREKFICYLKKQGIKTLKQKEVLCDLLDDKAKEHKVDNLWFIGVIGALSIPVWNWFVNEEFKNANIINITLWKNFLIIITFALAIVILIRFVINKSILKVLNIRSSRYKEMVKVLKEDLLLNEYNRSSSISKRKYKREKLKINMYL